MWIYPQGGKKFVDFFIRICKELLLLLDRQQHSAFVYVPKTSPFITEKLQFCLFGAQLVSQQDHPRVLHVKDRSVQLEA